MRARLRGAAGAAVLALLVLPVPAAADLESLKGACSERDAADGDTANGLTLPYRLCDDGLPPTGGRQPNSGAIAAIAVPQRYGGYAGLPEKVLPPDQDAGADANGDIALDANVSLPDPTLHPPPASGYPLVVMMHGCCAGNKTSWQASTVDERGERWHYSNAWFAARGYAVLTYTARGFVNGSNRGSTGETQLDDRRYEINDFQHLAGQLADDPFFRIDPTRVVVTGGSYGGGFSWMALTDPTWVSPGGRHMRLVAAAPKYGWTDLVESLVPSGRHLSGELPPTDGSASTTPIGFPKRSIVAALYGSGSAASTDHTTFPDSIDRAFTCFQSTDPFESNPLCGVTLQTVVPGFIANRSAYYQNEFFDRLVSDPVARVPVFSAGTFTDPLFPAVEHQRMTARLQAVVPGYPVQEYYGDYLHFAQSKAKEWGDLCGDDHHVCRLDDYPGGNLSADPAGLARRGVHTRLNRFVDHYARPPGNPDQEAPALDVTASLQICPENASPAFPADEPGEMLTAPSFAELAPHRFLIRATGSQVTTNDAEPNPHARTSDPLENQVANGTRCPVERSPGGAPSAGPGVATYDSPPLERDLTMVGRTGIFVPHTGSGSGVQLNARLYDLFPDGRQVMVDRGARRVADPNQPTAFHLHGNGWRFPAGHRVRVELAQDDDPFVKASHQGSVLVIPGALIGLPVREPSDEVAIPPLPGRRVRVRSPRLASDTGRGPAFTVQVLPASGEREGIDRYLLEVRDLRRSGYRVLTSTLRGSRFRFRGRFGRTYRFRARAIDDRGTLGPASFSTTIVPLDDFRGRSGPRYGGGWRRVRARSAYARRLSASTRRGAVMTFSFRGARRVYLVGRVGPRGGRALVVVDGRRRVASFYRRRPRSRMLVASLPTRRRVSSITVVNLGRRAGRSRGTRVEIDAIGVYGRRGSG